MVQKVSSDGSTRAMLPLSPPVRRRKDSSMSVRRHPGQMSEEAARDLCKAILVVAGVWGVAVAVAYSSTSRVLWSVLTRWVAAL